MRLRVNALASAGERLIYSARGLPRGLSIDRSTGLITGRLPVAAATDPVTVTVTDASGDRATVGFSFVIVGDLTAAYQPVTGPVTLGLPGLCLDNADPDRPSAPAPTAAPPRSRSRPATAAPPSSGPTARTASPTAPARSASTASASTSDPRRRRTCGSGRAPAAPTRTGPRRTTARTWSTRRRATASTTRARAPSAAPQVDVAACDSAAGQLFTLPPAPVTSAIPGQCLDVPGSSPAVGAAVDVADCDGSAGQLWGDFSMDTLKPATHGGLCLAAFAQAGPASLHWVGSPVELETCRVPFPTIEEGWSILPDGQIMNNTANLCLDDPGDSTANGTQLVLEDCYGEAGEIWAVG